MTCNQCTHYPLHKERLVAAEGCRVAMCYVHNVEVIGADVNCEDFKEADRKSNRYVPQAGVPRDTAATEAVQLKDVILSHPQLTNKELSKLTGIPKHQVSGIRAGRTWVDVPCQWECQKGGKSMRRMVRK